LTLGITKPHSPWYAPKEYFDRFPLETLKLAAIKKNDDEDCSKILVKDKDISQPWGWKKYAVVEKNGGDQQLLKWTQAYLACVAFMDDQVGKVLDALEEHPDKENTYVIFTSDHGYHMGEKGYLFKFSPWEESAKVPFLVVGPQIPAGEKCSNPVSLLDVFPTLVDLANLPEPSWSHRESYFDGFSMKPLLTSPKNGAWDGPDFTVTAIASKKAVAADQRANAEDQHFSIRTERYRYIRCRNGEEELYDHAHDPHEWHNLAIKPEMASVLRKMRVNLKGVGLEF
jgi:arylsulfatase A-like enzyme